MSKLKERLRIRYGEYLAKAIIIPIIFGILGQIFFLIKYMPGRLSPQQCHEGIFYTLKLPYAMALYFILVILLSWVVITILPLIQALWDTYATERMKRISLDITVSKRVRSIMNWTILIIIVLGIGSHIYKQYFCIM